MTFLFDNNFSPNLVAMLNALGVDAVALREFFPSDIKDEVFLPELRDLGVILVTADLRIQRVPVELQALKECGASAVFLRPGFVKKPKWEQANWLTKHWPNIEESARSLAPPVYLEVESNGKVARKQL